MKNETANESVANSVKPFLLESPYGPSGDQPAAIEKILENVDSGLRFQTLLGVTGSGKTFTAANVIARLQRPTLVLAPNKTLAAQLYGEFKSFFPHNAVEYFVSYYDYYQPEAYSPASDTFIEKDSAINEQIGQMRLSATKALFERPDCILVATVSAIYGLGDPRTYLATVLHLSRGEIINQRALLNRLVDLQYTRTPDLERGSFRVRGDLIDIFPAESEKYALRVEIFDDEISSLKEFDPINGRVLREVPRFTVFPATHYATPRDQMGKVVDEIKEELRTRLLELRSANRLVEAERLQSRTLFDIEMIGEIGYCSGIENYSRFLSGRPAGLAPPCLFDYLPANALLMVDESHVVLPQISGMYRGDRSRKETLVQYGFRLPSALDNRPLKFEEWEQVAPQMLFISATPGPYELKHCPRPEGIIEQVVRPTGLLDPIVEVRPARTQVDDVLFEIHKNVALGERILITTLTKRMAEDLSKYLLEQGVKARYMHSDIDTVERVEIIRDLRLGKFDVLIGINLLREGLDMPEVSLVAILDADKEGFLRSENSLIQTIGRAARHLNGRAILYADKVTGSMQRARDETSRRRTKQAEHNAAHGITPVSVTRSISDVMESGRDVTVQDDTPILPTTMDPEKLAKRLKRLENAMKKHAKNMEFELAAKARDEISALRAMSLGLSTEVPVESG